VVERSGAAMLEEICHGNERRVIDNFTVNLGENGINLVEPVDHKKVRIINGYQVSYKRLEEVMVRIHQSWIHNVVACIDDLGVTLRKILSNLCYLVSVDQKITIGIHRIRSIATHERTNICKKFLVTHHLPPYRLDGCTINPIVTIGSRINRNFL